MDDSVTLVRAAAGGDQGAWNELVTRYVGLVWGIARSYRLDSADAADVVQTTWMRLVEQLPRIREPEHLGGWLATTARREALRVLRATGREAPTDNDVLDVIEPAGDDATLPESRMLQSEREEALWAALEAAPEHCRQLLRVMSSDPAPSYAEVAAALDMPVGSIGPTRMRCLRCLRRLLEAKGVGAGHAGA